MKEGSKPQGVISLGESGMYRQNYEKQSLPSGVVVYKTQVFSDGEGGHFLEIARNSGGDVGSLLERNINLNINQINVSIIAPGTRRFGHLHPNQHELWTVTSGVLRVALYDARLDADSAGNKSVIVATPGTQIYIPSRVAHGFVNCSSEPASLCYIASHQFSSGQDTQELRFIPEDPNFWDFALPVSY